MDGDKKEIGEIYKKLDATYNKLIGKANERIKLIVDLTGVCGVCHFFNDKRPCKEEINKFVKELLKFAIKSLKVYESEYVCVKPDRSYLCCINT